MKYSSVNLGQIEALINILGGEAVLRSILDGTSKVRVEIIRRLATLTLSTVEAGEVNLKEFFATRAGLLVSDDFKKYILAGVSNENVSATETTICYAGLTQPTNDAEIGSGLPKDYVFEKVDTFLVHLATLIKGQWGGKKGDLLNNNYSNIFYVKQNDTAFTVFVDWCSSDQVWRCRASRLDGRRYLPGGRAFSATAA